MDIPHRRLVIIGATSNEDLFELIEACNRVAAETRYVPVAFLDDEASLHGTNVRGLPVLGSLETARKQVEDAWFINAIGTYSTVAKRRRILERTGVSMDRFVTFIHPRAVVSHSAHIGNGCLVFAGAVIGAEVELGGCSDVMPNAVLSHGCRIGAYTFIASGVMIGGLVRIGEACFLGLNCSVRELLSIGSHSILGQGSVVVKDVSDDMVMVGNPARELRGASA